MGTKTGGIVYDEEWIVLDGPDTPAAVTGDAAPGAHRRPSAPSSKRAAFVGFVTSLPVLVCLLVFITVLASGPLHGLDRALNQPWSEWVFPEWRSFVDDIIDPIASQAVIIPILGITAGLLSMRHRTWRPLLIAAAAEFGVVGMVGAMKIIIARPSPVLEDPSFFHGGFFSQGGYGIIYPSGHAAQSIALYGILVFLLSRYSQVSKNTINLLSVGVGIIAIITMFSSIYLGWHWATDLWAGFITGGLVLRATVYFNDMIPSRIPRATSMQYSFPPPVPRTARSTVPVADPDVDEPVRRVK
ncbi:phosphatase PAP2 family protein [Arthrobacter castelli]|uniref:phosphatase PAP2 family protein n=1 Tax=Arthrobacter castelli TaxID=271431 RepID=UPI0012DE7798|nr:phosphatase PAP2 family protein [Arthrobacter castelli]